VVRFEPAREIENVVDAKRSWGELPESLNSLTLSRSEAEGKVTQDHDLFVAQGDHGVDAGSAPRRDIAGQERNGG
jgi:hypothetical protein